MDKKPQKTHCTLSLSDYKSYSFDAEGCVIYLKGTIATGNIKKKKTGLSLWQNLLAATKNRQELL